MPFQRQMPQPIQAVRADSIDLAVKQLTTINFPQVDWEALQAAKQSSEIQSKKAAGLLAVRLINAIILQLLMGKLSLSGATAKVLRLLETIYHLGVMDSSYVLMMLNKLFQVFQRVFQTPMLFSPMSVLKNAGSINPQKLSLNMNMIFDSVVDPSFTNPSFKIHEDINPEDEIEKPPEDFESDEKTEIKDCQEILHQLAIQRGTKILRPEMLKRSEKFREQDQHPYGQKLTESAQNWVI